MSAAPDSAGTIRLNHSKRLAARTSFTPGKYTFAPTTSQQNKYPKATKITGAPEFPFSVRARRKRNNIGSADGSIIATIMASHISRNIAEDAVQAWPGIRIHIMDLVQPPGMSIPPDIQRQE